MASATPPLATRLGDLGLLGHGEPPLLGLGRTVGLAFWSEGET